MGCGVAQSPAPVPAVLAAASEPAGHAATVTTAAANSSEERTAAPRPASEKAKNEEVSPAPLSSRDWCRRVGRKPGASGLTSVLPPST